MVALTFLQNLGLNQEWIELDLFHNALARFSVQEWEDAGINAEYRFLIEFMADQEVGHARLLTDMLGRTLLIFYLLILSHCPYSPSCQAVQIPIPLQHRPRIHRLLTEGITHLNSPDKY